MSLAKNEITPSINWPIKRKIVLLDAYFHNPIEVRVIKHPNSDHLITEDERGIVYYARTDRVVGFADSDREITDSYDDDFADILG